MHLIHQMLRFIKLKHSNGIKKTQGQLLLVGFLCFVQNTLKPRSKVCCNDWNLKVTDAQQQIWALNRSH